MPIWLLTSFSLPVVTTTGRLMTLFLHALWRNPPGMATFEAATSITVAVSWTLLAVQERRILRRGSTS